MIAQSAVPDRTDTVKYIVNPARSELVVKLSRWGLAAAQGHAIRWTDFSGEIGVDLDDFSITSLGLTVQAGSMLADEPAIREKYGLTAPIGDKGQRKMRSALESPAQMDIKKYPTVRFEATSAERQSNRRYIIIGDLTIRDVTRSLTFPAVVEEEGGTLRGRTTIGLRQSDFEIKPYNAVLGAVLNRDAVVLYLDIIAAASRRETIATDRKTTA